MTMRRRGEDWKGEQAPNPGRRLFGKRTLLVIGGVVIADQIPPYLIWHDNQTRVEQGRINTKRLALVVPGIGRKDAPDVVGALRPGLSGPDTTVRSLVYGDSGMSAKASADAVRASDCSELILVGQSIGGGHGVEMLEELRPDIVAGTIKKPVVVFLHTPHSGQNLVNGAAGALSYIPSGLTKKFVGEPIAYGKVTNASPDLGESQLDFAVDFNGAYHVAGISDLISAALYIGDESPDGDGVIYTVAASEGYKGDLGDKLTVKLVSGLGHPDPAKISFQAATYNQEISTFLATAA